jgi:RNAse (barnase) inhibitor barstar
MKTAATPTFEFVSDLTGFRAPEFKLVRLAGRLRRKGDLFRALDAGLNFPAYFGQNWDALEECLCDLTWLELAKGVVLLHHKLPLANQSQRSIYLDILTRAQMTNRALLRVIFPLAAKHPIPRSACGNTSIARQCGRAR